MFGTDCWETRKIQPFNGGTPSSFSRVYPRSSLSELETHTTPKSWSLESRKLAIEYGYLYGHLRGGTNGETAAPLPDGYLTRAKSVAERRGALAGYRLCDEIQKYLVLGRTVPLLPANTITIAVALPKEIGTDQATKYYDEDMVVTGKVVNVSMRSTIAILDLDERYPEFPADDRSGFRRQLRPVR